MSHYVAFPDEDVYHAWTKAGAGGQPAILTMCGKHGRKTTREEQTYDDGSPRPEIHYGQPPEERTPCEACRRELVPYFENGFSPGSGAAQSCAAEQGPLRKLLEHIEAMDTSDYRWADSLHHYLQKVKSNITQ